MRRLRGHVAEVAAPLTNRQFRVFFAAQVISSAGGAVAPITLAFAILHLGGRGTGIAVVLGAEFSVYIALLPVAGVIADRMPGKPLLIASQVVLAFFQLAEATLILSGVATVWSLAAVSGGGAAGAALFTPVGRRLLAQLLPGAALARANALTQATKHGIAALGPMAGGVLIVTIGAGWGILWDCLTYTAAAVLFTRLPTVRTTGEQNPGRPAGVRLAELSDGIHAITSRTWLWTTTLADCVTGGAFAAAMLIGPLYAREHLHGALSWGTITGTLAAATSIGSILAARWPSRRPGILMSLGTASTAAGFAAMSADLPLPITVAGTLLAGLAFGPAQVARVTALQQHIPVNQLGRVAAYQELATVLPTPIVYAAAGTAADTLGPRTVLAVCAALIAGPALLPLTIPSVRHLTTRTTPGGRATARPRSPEAREHR
ncbi:MFS transporter [Actinoallomurus spadix]|uniref:MFS transporter n=1 Tax=Actinoallomurus spadix TaxID=79912 RepID=A0ABN0X943_9ACTN|nr:MFS transporter [Actinoallomurus spadix]MCO5991707.1 MFS transporter [Actinoallomurus spadix]